MPIPDAGVCGGNAIAWRAFEVFVEKPTGLIAFQVLLTQATNNDNLNFIIAEDLAREPLDFDQAEWQLQLGDADAEGGGCYVMSSEYPPASANAVVDTGGVTRSIATPDDLEFVVLARLPFATPLPLTHARVAGVVSEDRQQITDGRVEGVVLGEVAAATLLDLQSDDDPSNDQPLANFLGDPDVDEDGDAIVDDYSAVFAFQSIRVGLEE